MNWHFCSFLLGTFNASQNPWTLLDNPIEKERKERSITVSTQLYSDLMWCVVLVKLSSTAELLDISTTKKRHPLPDTLLRLQIYLFILGFSVQSWGVEFHMFTMFSCPPTSQRHVSRSVGTSKSPLGAKEFVIPCNSLVSTSMVYFHLISHFQG